MDRRACVTAIMLASFSAIGCDRAMPEIKTSKSQGVVKKVGASSKRFDMKGVVRKVDAGSGEVTIAHEAIPGLMPKMTMPFSLKDKSLLEDVRPGDEVEGPLRVEFDGEDVKEMTLTDLTVTRPAPSTTPEAEIPAPKAPETLKPGDAVPDFLVTTQDGSKLRLVDLRGEVVVLTFIYTRCPSPEFCPAIDARFAELARRISAVPGRSEHVRLLSVSFDPEHDTPEVLAAHARRRGATPPLWTFAVASFEELSKVAGPLGLTYIPGTREIDHNLRTAVIGPDGRLNRLEIGQGWAPAELIKTVLTLVTQARK